MDCGATVRGGTATGSEAAAPKATVHRLATAIPSGAMRPHHARMAKSGESRHKYHRRHGPTTKTLVALRTVFPRPPESATEGPSEATGIGAVYALGESLVGVAADSPCSLSSEED
jgi:hypothetical protein